MKQIPLIKEKQNITKLTWHAIHCNVHWQHLSIQWRLNLHVVFLSRQLAYYGPQYIWPCINILNKLNQKRYNRKPRAIKALQKIRLEYQVQDPLICLDINPDFGYPISACLRKRACRIPQRSGIIVEHYRLCNRATPRWEHVMQARYKSSLSIY